MNFKNLKKNSRNACINKGSRLNAVEDSKAASDNKNWLPQLIKAVCTLQAITKGWVKGLKNGINKLSNWDR